MKVRNTRKILSLFITLAMIAGMMTFTPVVAGASDAIFVLEMGGLTEGSSTQPKTARANTTGLGDAKYLVFEVETNSVGGMGGAQIVLQGNGNSWAWAMTSVSPTAGWHGDLSMGSGQNFFVFDISDFEGIANFNASTSVEVIFNGEARPFFETSGEVKRVLNTWITNADLNKAGFTAINGTTNAWFTKDLDLDSYLNGGGSSDYTWADFLASDLVEISQGHIGTAATISSLADGIVVSDRDENYRGFGLNVRGLAALKAGDIVITGSITGGGGGWGPRFELYVDGDWEKAIEGNATSVTISAASASSLATGTAHRICTNGDSLATSFKITSITVGGTSVLELLGGGGGDTPAEILNPASANINNGAWNHIGLGGGSTGFPAGSLGVSNAANFYQGVDHRNTATGFKITVAPGPGVTAGNIEFSTHANSGANPNLSFVPTASIAWDALEMTYTYNSTTPIYASGADWGQFWITPQGTNDFYITSIIFINASEDELTALPLYTYEPPAAGDCPVGECVWPAGEWGVLSECTAPTCNQSHIHNTAGTNGSCEICGLAAVFYAVAHVETTGYHPAHSERGVAFTSGARVKPALQAATQARITVIPDTTIAATANNGLKLLQNQGAPNINNNSAVFGDLAAGSGNQVFTTDLFAEIPAGLNWLEFAVIYSGEDKFTFEFELLAECDCVIFDKTGVQADWEDSCNCGETPAPEFEAGNNVVQKAAAEQKSVEFTLKTAIEGTWFVYAAAEGGSALSAVSAASDGTKLTLTSATADLPATNYYVSVKDGDKAESARVQVTVVGFGEKFAGVGAQTGTLISGNIGSATFTLTTVGIDTDSDISLINTNSVAGISLVTTKTTGNSTTVTISITTATPHGTHPLKLTVDGEETDSFNLVVLQKTAAVGAQSGTARAGTEGTVTFPVTTTNIADGEYTVSVSNLPDDVEVDGKVTIAGNAGTLKLAISEDAVASVTSTLRLTIDGAQSAVFTLTILPAQGGNITYKNVYLLESFAGIGFGDNGQFVDGHGIQRMTWSGHMGLNFAGTVMSVVDNALRVTNATNANARGIQFHGTNDFIYHQNFQGEVGKTYRIIMEASAVTTAGNLNIVPDNHPTGVAKTFALPTTKTTFELEWEQVAHEHNNLQISSTVDFNVHSIKICEVIEEAPKCINPDCIAEDCDCPIHVFGEEEGDCGECENCLGGGGGSQVIFTGSNNNTTLGVGDWGGHEPVIAFADTASIWWGINRTAPLDFLDKIVEDSYIEVTFTGTVPPMLKFGTAINVPEVLLPASPDQPIKASSNVGGVATFTYDDIIDALPSTYDLSESRIMVFFGDGAAVTITKIELFSGGECLNPVVCTCVIAEDNDLISITDPEAIGGIPNGVSVEMLESMLPDTVAIVTTQNSTGLTAAVVWDVEGSDYDPDEEDEQTFVITGAVTLPEGVKNPGDVPLTAAISVTVVDINAPAAYVSPAQSKVLTVGTAGETTFTLTTANIEDGTEIELNNINDVDGIELVTEETTDNSTIITVSITADTPAGSHPLSLSIDDLTTNVFYLVVSEDTKSNEANITQILGRNVTWAGGDGSSASARRTASISVGNSVSSIANSNITVSVGATPVITAGAGSLVVGTNTVDITVTAENGTTQMFYRVTITRDKASSGGGGGGGGTPSDPTTPTTPAPVVAQPGAPLTLPANFTIPATTVAALRGDALLPAATIRATAAGNQTINFGTTAEVAGQNAILVRIGADGELEVVSAATIGANGQATVNVPASGDYLVLARKTGDITGTGEVQTQDALALLRHIAGIAPLNALELFVANGKIGDTGTTDALNILRYIAGITDKI
ncbi:MAG: hypothetical protein FWE74_06045 [Oscillospiraceae bacterium]|nr:hypothetical protein [Oscillospiraceae bacterium]